MENVRAIVFTMDEFNNLLSQVTDDNMQLVNECGEWFFVETEGLELDESDIIERVAKFLNIETVHISVDISKNMVILY